MGHGSQEIKSKRNQQKVSDIWATEIVKPFHDPKMLPLFMFVFICNCLEERESFCVVWQLFTLAMFKKSRMHYHVT